MHDEYFEEVFHNGPIVLKVGDTHSFTFERIGGWPEKSYVIKLISVDGETALITINGDEYTLERKMQHFIDRLVYRCILFEADAVTLVYGDQMKDF